MAAEVVAESECSVWWVPVCQRRSAAVPQGIVWTRCEMACARWSIR